MSTPRLDLFISALTDLVERTQDEAEILQVGRGLLHELVRQDDWLPPEFAQPDTQRYQQYPLYVDPRGRFSVVSFVWGPGQATPIHDHTVWGLIGMLRGAEQCQSYGRTAQGTWASTSLPASQLAAMRLPRRSVGPRYRVEMACRAKSCFPIVPSVVVRPYVQRPCHAPMPRCACRPRLSPASPATCNTHCNVAPVLRCCTPVLQPRSVTARDGWSQSPFRRPARPVTPTSNLFGGSIPATATLYLSVGS